MRDASDVTLRDRKAACLLIDVSIPSDNVLKKTSERNTEAERTMDWNVKVKYQKLIESVSESFR
jgi:hypothetical protein